MPYFHQNNILCSPKFILLSKRIFCTEQIYFRVKLSKYQQKIRITEENGNVTQEKNMLHYQGKEKIRKNTF